MSSHKKKIDAEKMAQAHGASLVACKSLGKSRENLVALALGHAAYETLQQLVVCTSWSVLPMVRTVAQ